MLARARKVECRDFVSSYLVEIILKSWGVQNLVGELVYLFEAYDALDYWVLGSSQNMGLENLPYEAGALIFDLHFFGIVKRLFGILEDAPASHAAVLFLVTEVKKPWPVNDNLVGFGLLNMHEIILSFCRSRICTRLELPKPVVFSMMSAPFLLAMIQIQELLLKQSGIHQVVCLKITEV